MEVKLYKRKGTYQAKDTGEEKSYTNFFLKCGDVLIPIEVKYFEGAKGEKDRQYSGRMTVLDAFSETLPPKEARNSTEAASATLQTKPVRKDISEDDIPF